MPRTKPPPVDPFTEVWAAALPDALNGSMIFQKASRDWIWPFALVMDEDEEFGFHAAVSVVLDIHKGVCRGSTFQTGVPDLEFVLRGRYIQWRRVMRDGLDPITSVIKGQLRITGPMVALLENVDAVHWIVACVRSVPATYQEDPPLNF